MKKKSKKIQVHTNDQVYKEIENIKLTTGESASSICSKLIEEALNARSATAGVDALIPVLEKALANPLKSLENRLAAINAKTNIQAGVARYLLEKALASKDRDILAMVEEARKKAVLDLQTK